MPTSRIVLPSIIEQFASTGRYPATINLGAPVLAQEDLITGEPRGVSVDFARELG